MTRCWESMRMFLCHPPPSPPLFIIITFCSPSHYYKYLAGCSLFRQVIWFTTTPFTSECLVHTENTESPSSHLPSLFYSLTFNWKWAQTGLRRDKLNGEHLGVVRISAGALIPVLKMRSQAAVWSCHVLVLRLLCSSTGVTIIMPNVLIICREDSKRGHDKVVI